MKRLTNDVESGLELLAQFVTEEEDLVRCITQDGIRDGGDDEVRCVWAALEWAGDQVKRIKRQRARREAKRVN